MHWQCSHCGQTYTASHQWTYQEGDQLVRAGANTYAWCRTVDKTCQPFSQGLELLVSKFAPELSFFFLHTSLDVFFPDCMLLCDLQALGPKMKCQHAC